MPIRRNGSPDVQKAEAAETRPPTLAFVAGYFVPYSRSPASPRPGRM